VWIKLLVLAALPRYDIMFLEILKFMIEQLEGTVWAMIYIVTALMLEASPIIGYFNLKRDMTINSYPVFSNKEIALIVSGIGKVKSAMAATFLISNYRITGSDILINIGFCGAQAGKYPLGTLLLVNKVTDVDTGKDYYPDVYIGDDLPKDSVACCPRPVGDNDNQYECSLFDMESAGIMEAAYKFFNTQQIAIIKIVSDFLSPENLDKQVLRSYIDINMPILDRILNELKQLNSMVTSLDFEAEDKLISLISQNLNLTSAMKQILETEVRNAKRKGLKILEILERHIESKANTKPEGKKIFGEIIKDIKQQAF